MRLVPIVHFFTDFVLGMAVTLLDFTLKLIAAAIDDIEIIVG